MQAALYTLHAFGVPQLFARINELRAQSLPRETVWGRMGMSNLRASTRLGLGIKMWGERRQVTSQYQLMSNELDCVEWFDQYQGDSSTLRQQDTERGGSANETDTGP